MYKRIAITTFIIGVFFAAHTTVNAVNYGAGTYNSGLYSATSADITPPIISFVSSGSPTQTAATITWTTNENADSQVEYGLTTSYGTTTILDTTMTTSHSVILSGLFASTTYHYRVISKDAATNTAIFSDSTFTTSAVSDTTAPVRSAGSPSGTLASGTTSTTISITTDESATCRYSTTAGVAYASMGTTFSTTGGTAQSTTVSGLTNGDAYNYYVRCSDTSSNVNTSDYTISFTVAATTVVVAPAPKMLASGMITPSTNPNAGCTSGGAFSTLTGKRCPVSITISNGLTSVSQFRTLSLKMKGEDVRVLQHYLNTHGYPVAVSGVGSLGRETNYFGLATKAALIKLQKVNALTGDGVLGPKTRAYINNH